MSRRANSVIYEEARPQSGTVFWRWFVVLLYAGSVFAVSAVPGNSLPSFGVSDKLLHAAEFGVLAFLLCRALRVQIPTYSRHFIMSISILITISYGVTDEAHQLLVANRMTDLADLAADGFGALLAAWGWLQVGTRWPWLQ